MRHLLVFMDIMNSNECGYHARDGGRAQWQQLEWQWGKNFSVKGKVHEIQ